jgi:hypothetical protein
VKDLPDLALLGTIRPIEAARLRAAIEQTFMFRATHECPAELPEPPPEWRDPYASIAADDSLPWPTLEDVFEAAKSFVAPVLGDAACPPIWTPSTRRWESDTAGSRT